MDEVSFELECKVSDLEQENFKLKDKIEDLKWQKSMLILFVFALLTVLFL